MKRIKPPFGLVTLLLFALLFCASQPVEARDRPGTPNQEALFACGPATTQPTICGFFNNTATEVVKIEMEMTRNGAPFAYDSNGINCSNLAVRRVQNTVVLQRGMPPVAVEGTHDIPEAVCYMPYQTYGRKKDDPDYKYMFALGADATDFATQYCARFRARRVSDQIVSENWSNYACVRTPPKPPLPPKPDFTVRFSGSQAYLPGTEAGSKAALGQTAKVIPNTTTIVAGDLPNVVFEYEFSDAGCRCITVPNNPYSLDSVSWRADDGGSDGQHTVTASIGAAQDTATFTLCAINAAGRTCKSKKYSTLTQSEVLTHSPSTGSFAAAAAARLMPGVDLPGNDYSSKPISGTAIDCQAACALDGKCVAWTWVKPGVQNSEAMCWLKSSIPASTPNVNATSGIKGGSR